LAITHYLTISEVSLTMVGTTLRREVVNDE